MVCENCKTKMICDNSREERNVRWRTYWCPNCSRRIGTRETIGDYQKIKEKAKIINTAQKLKRSLRFAE